MLISGARRPFPMRRVLSILFYSGAGAVFYTAAFVGFLASSPEMGWAVGMMGLFGAFLLLLGLWLAKFRTPARDCGVVLICAAGLGATVLLNWFFVIEHPEMQKVMGPSHVDFAVHYPRGIVGVFLLGAGGAFLLWKHNRRDSQGA